MQLRSWGYRLDFKWWCNSRTRVPRSMFLILLAGLKACGRTGEYTLTKAMDCYVHETGMVADIHVASTLVDTYGKCGFMLDAQRVFEGIGSPNVVTWTALVLGYAENGQGVQSLTLLELMLANARYGEMLQPNSVTYMAALKACTGLASEEAGRAIEGKVVKLGSLEKGMKVHSLAAKAGCDKDIFVSNSTVGMYASCGSLGLARRVFDTMPDHNLVSWNTMMLGYAENGEEQLAFALFESLQETEELGMNRVTLLAALKACSSLSSGQDSAAVSSGDNAVKLACLEKGMAIHAQAAKRYSTSESQDMYRDTVLVNSLLDTYAKCGSIMDARRVFDRSFSHTEVSWNSLMQAYVDNQGAALALEVYQEMNTPPNRVTFLVVLKACSCLAGDEQGKQVDGKSVKLRALKTGSAVHSQATHHGLDKDMFVVSSLIDMYAKCGSMSQAQQLFDELDSPDNVALWNALILGYVDNGDANKGLQVFVRMLEQDGCPADETTLMAALRACGSVSALEVGKQVCALAFRGGAEEDKTVATGIVDLYGKCGNVADAKNFFDSSVSSVNVNVNGNVTVTWTALIAGYSRHGDPRDTFQLYRRMQEEGVAADGVTYLCLLTACSHAGLVKHGRVYFKAMQENVVTPTLQHYHCMVDLLGRANHLDEAVKLVETMPFTANSVTWMTVLSAARKWKVVEVGRLAFESFLRLERQDVTAYTLMSGIYSSAGMWEEVSKVQAMRVAAGAWNMRPACSWWSDPNTGRVHRFRAGGEEDHPQRSDIEQLVKQLMSSIKEEFGYVAHLPSASSLRNFPSDKDKEDALCGHSEKLALACALLNTGDSAPNSTIRIIKNLRVCEDCHAVFSHVSRVQARRILCRDSSRFHVFQGGRCECGDFW